MSTAVCVRGRLTALALALAFWASPLTQPAARAEGTVTTSTTTALLQAMLGGGLVKLAISSTLTLEVPLVIASDTILEGAAVSGTPVVLSGGGNLRLIRVLPGVRCELRNLELRQGISTNGGGVFNEGTLLASNVLFIACTATGMDGAAGKDGANEFGFGKDGEDGQPGRPAAGGAFYNTGEATLQACRFSVNAANGGDGGAGGKGGQGSFREGRGGHGGAAAGGLGGAIASSGWLAVSNSVFLGNAVRGGNGGAGGSNGSVIGAGQGAGGADAAGGAIHNTGWLLVVQSSFTTNLVTGGAAADAGAPYFNVGEDGAGGGSAFGGAISSWSTGIVVNTTFYTNLLAGGVGGDGASGTFFVGDGGNGGSAYGAAIHANGRLSVTNATLAWNTGTAGLGGAAGATVRGSAGKPGRLAGGGIAADSRAEVRVINTLFATAGEVSTVDGPVVDLGHNLFTDEGPGTPGPGTLLHRDPLLSGYQVWSIGTPGFLLQAGSPALDAADPAAAPTVDQRGLPRPGGVAPDIGALELGASTYSITGQVLDGTLGVGGVRLLVGTHSTVTSAEGRFRFDALSAGFYTVELADGGIGYTPRLVQIPLTADATNVVFRTSPLVLSYEPGGWGGTDAVRMTGGIPGRAYRLEGSADLNIWQLLGSAAADAQGRVQYSYQPGMTPLWFYRVVSP